MSCPSCFLFPVHPLILTRRCAHIHKFSRQLHHLPKLSNKAGLISAKLPRNGKGQKRVALAAGLAPPPDRRPQFAIWSQNPEDVSSGAMQNAQAGGGQWPNQPPSFRRGDRQLGVSYPANHDHEGHITPAGVSSPHPPDFGSRPFQPRASIEEPAVHACSYNQVQQPVFEATTPLPIMPFPPQPSSLASNNTPWRTDMQDSGPLPAAPSMPHVNPRFFNPSMGGIPRPPTFPMMPFNPLLQFQNTQLMSTLSGSPAAQSQTPRKQRETTPPMKIPAPTEAYIKQASQAPKLRSHPQPLLIILDLNGTLIFRKHKKLPPSFARRAGLEQFLDELTQKYSVMIWSSSKPATVSAICKRLFPDDKKDSIVAMWGRDKFDLTHAQYNAKLQVYKELRKVWADPQIQASYPGSEPVNTNAAPSHPGGEFSKRNKKRQENNSNESAQSPPVGQRWDQTNTILIDDSKLKALGEPYNILEIPEFKGNLSIDESTLFTNVLRKLDILCRHDDVSKMMRLVNELAEKERKPVLDMEFPDSNGVVPFEEEDVSDGGVKLVPPTKPKGKKTAPKNTPEGQQIAEQKKAAKKARKQAKKEAKRAAQAAQQPAADKSSTARPSGPSQKGSVTETAAPNAATSALAPAPESAPGTNPDGSVRISRRQRRQQALAARREAKALAQQSAPAEPEAEPVTAETRKGYNLRKRDPGNDVPFTEADASMARRCTDTIFKIEGITPDGEPFSYVKQVDGNGRERSPSSASDSSRNSLLDRLEDGLGIHRW